MVDPDLLLTVQSLYNAMIGMDFDIRDSCYKGTILERNYSKTCVKRDRSHCVLVDKPLAMQTRSRRSDSQLHQSVG